MKKWIYLIILFSPISSILGNFDANYIEPTPNWGVGGGYVAWGDYNNDGYLDLAMTGDRFGNYVFRVYKNKGDGTFDPNYIEPTPGWGISGSIAWGDFNNDGNLDLAVAGYDENSYVLRIYKNKGNGTFDPNYIEPTPGWGVSGSITWLDFNNDGNLDLAVVGRYWVGSTSYCTLRIYLNNGDGTLNPNYIEPLPGWNLSGNTIAWGDFNNDGNLDLAVADFFWKDGNVYLTLRVYKNNGDGTMDPNYIEPLPGRGAINGSLAWGDFNNDGNLDLAISGDCSGYYAHNPSPVLAIFKNNGNGTFDTNFIRPMAPENIKGSIAWGDLNNDGNLDLAVVGNRSYSWNEQKLTFRVYKNLESTINQAI